MIQVLLDTNIILDFALERIPHVQKAEQLLQLAFQNKIIAYISASTVTDIYYIMRKNKTSGFILDFLKSLLEIVDIAPVNKKVIIEALSSGIIDFEDAVQDHSALNLSIDYIVTRNSKDFKNAHTQIKTPGDFLKFYTFDELISE